MKKIASNEKYVLSLVDPDEVFDILGKGDTSDLYCRILKGSYQKATHLLKSLTVTTVKSYIEKAKDNNPNEFIIFYRVVENRDENPMLTFIVDNKEIKIPKSDCIDAALKCDKGCDMVSYCPFFGRRDIETHLMCRNILEAFAIGDYMIDKEDDKND